MTAAAYMKPFGELAEFRNGVNFSAESRGAGDLAVIGVGAFQANERMTDFDHLEKIVRPKGLGNDALLRDGDLIFVRSNGNKELIGRCMLLTGITTPVSHSGFTIRARVTSNEVTPEWIGQYFSTGLAKRSIMRRGGGTNISNLSQQILQDLPIPILRPEQQQKVLRIAERFTRVLELLEAAIREKHRFKRGLMEQLLTGQQRFPEFAVRAWESHRLGELVQEVERPVAWDDSFKYRLVSIRRRSGGMFLREEKTGSDIKTKQLYVVRTGDIVLSRMQVVHGATAIVPPEFDGCHVSGTYLVLVPRANAALDPKFLDHLLSTPRMYHAAYTSSYGVHIEKMTFNPEWYLETPIFHPPTLQEQMRIAQTLDLCDTEISLLETQRGQFESYKRGLIRDLLGGETVIQ